MNERVEDARALAELWIRCWQEGRPDDIPLADGFIHVSPFGRLEGRQHYLRTVKPMAAQNVTKLRVLGTLAAPDQAAIFFEMDTPGGTIPVCDWVFSRDGLITEIRSHYDATMLRAGDPG